jgi:hypothetical protein
MFFEDPLEVPLRITGASGDGIDIETAFNVVVDPVE